MAIEDPDVIVVGAGMAGAAAAAGLAAAGRTVVVVEARRRVGGRGYLKRFAGDHETAPLEFGGAWITPWHGRLRALAEAHGIALRPRHPVTGRFHLRGGAVHGDGAVAPEDRPAHEKALARVAIDAILLKKGLRENERGAALRGISFAAYLDRLDCPEATRALFSAWWTVSGNGRHDAVAASEFLASCAYEHGLAERMIHVWADTLVPGMAVLAERMLTAAGVKLRTDEAVTRVERTAEGVAVHAVGTAHRARACVLALGINQLRGIGFAPALPSAKAAAIATGHGGASFKLWLRMRGVPVGTLITGDGTGIEFAFTEREAANGDTLAVCFGLMGGDNRPGDPEWVRNEAARLFPNAQFLGYDWHDWVDDPFARGTWVAAPAGQEDGLDAANWQPEGHIAFASSDYARDQAGWFEGAVISGEDAAAALLKLL